MRLFSGELLVTEIAVEGVELGHEFEVGHCESTELILNELQKKYNKNGERVQNMYDNSVDYTVVIVKADGSKYSVAFDFGLIEPYIEIIERELYII